MITHFARSAMLLASIIVATPETSTPAAAATPANPEGGCAIKTQSGLGYTMLVAGSDAAPVDTDTVAISYRGTLASDGTLFDESERAEFGVRDVIPGFTEGLMLLKVGGRIRLCIPSSLGYGARATGAIPANSDLVFEVGLLEIKKVPGPLAAGDRLCPTKSASGLGYAVMKAGTGAQPTDNDVTLVNYKGYLAASGAPFDNAGPVPIPVGRVIPGFAEGLKLMQRGGTYKLCIPAPLGYGDKAAGPIPPNSALVFLVDLIDFKSLAEIQALQTQSGQ